MEAENVRENFCRLDFAFRERDTGQLVGFAPEGRIGIVEVASEPDDTTVSLLVSTDEDVATAVWSAVCVSSLIQAVGVDFAAWLNDHVRRLGYERMWSVSREFGPRWVSAAFFPADTLLITVGVQSPTRQQ